LKPELNLVDARKLLEEQFRVRLYKDIKYPFLPAMGTRHMFQAFDNTTDDGSWRNHIGTLHLWWSNESGEPSYHTKDKQFINGYWKLNHQKPLGLFLKEKMTKWNLEIGKLIC